MNRFTRLIAAPVAILTLGCNGEIQMGPGKFAHAAIQRTIAPWDGAATCFVFSELPISPEQRRVSRVEVVVYTSVEEAAKSRIRMEGMEKQKGYSVWIDAEGKMTPLTSAEIGIEAITGEAVPIEGWYDLTFPDGRRERGHFRANWWPREGRGG